jgi:translocation and assembly module TamB
MKRRLFLIAALLSLVILVLAARSPQVSEFLKTLLLPELADATGRNFTVQQISVNLLPLFVEMRDVKAYDDRGETMVSAGRVKGYVDLSGLFTKEVIVRKIAIRDFVYRSGRAELDDLIARLKRYLAEEKKGPVKVTVKSLDIRNAALSVTGVDPQGSATGIHGDVQLSPFVRCRLTAESLRLQKSGMKELESTVSAFFTVENSDVQIKELTVRSSDSSLKTSGAVDAKSLTGQLQTELFLVVETVKELLGLEKPGQGTISVAGLVKADMNAGLGGLFADLTVSGDCYLETLMAVLKVKERLAGHVRFKGTVGGQLNALTAAGQAELTGGDIFGVRIDSVHCDIDYRDGIMRFVKGRASLYGGTAEAEASITLPAVERFSFNASFRNVSSTGVFELLAWDPHIPKGVVSGEVSSSGTAFNPAGSFSYKSTEQGKDIMGKIKTVDGSFSMENEVVQFPRMALTTDSSALEATGTVDLRKGHVFFSAKGQTTDMVELTAPYFTAITGNAAFEGTVSGPLDDIEIALNAKGKDVRLSAGKLDEPKVVNDADLVLGDVAATVRYKKNFFTAESVVARSADSEYRATGTVTFPKAQNLFDLAGPVYDLTISARKGDLASTSRLFKDIPPIRGLLDIQTTMKGRPGAFTFKGDFSSTSLAVNGYAIDRLEGSGTFVGDTLHLKRVQIKKGAATVSASGSLSLEKDFSLDADVANMRLADVIPNVGEGGAAALSRVSLTGVKVKGEGTFDKPSLRFSASVETNGANGRGLGKGALDGSLRGRSLSLRAALLDGRMTAKVTSELVDAFPWEAEAELQQGRYDGLLSQVLKDTPEDLLLILKGSFKASGDRNTVRGFAEIDKATVNLYGNAFTNRNPLVVKINNRNVMIETMSFSSDATEFTIGGTLALGKSYNLSLEGASSLAPLRAFSKQVDLLKGKSYYSFSIAGEWEKPRISGAIQISEGSLGFKNVPYRLTSIAAYIYFDEDKAVIEQGQAKLSGGDVDLVGSASFDGLRIKKFSLESRIKGITASPSKNFWLTLDGDLYFRGTQESQLLHGEIQVRRAHYSERIDLQSLAVKGLSREVARQELTKIEQTLLNVKISAPHVVINNNLARATARVDLLMRGTIADPVPIGKVETLDGIVYFRSNEFKLVRATLDFATPDRIDPFFDIAAETKIANYDVRLSLSGRTDRFNLLLASSPPLSEQDIFSLLTVGRVGDRPGSAGAATGAEQAATVGSFFTEKIEAEVEDRIKTVVGFDRIDITPYVSKTRGTITPRLSVTKKLLGDRLYVTYSTTVETGEMQIWKLEYALNKNLSLIGSRDETGGMGGDVKFRFEFR